MISLLIGGAAGAVLRAFFTDFFKKRGAGRYAVSLVNGIGSFIAGTALAIVLTESWAPFFVTGFLGAFTTFSTLQLEGAQLVREKGWRAGIRHTVLSLLLSIAAAAWGFGLVKSISIIVSL